MLDSNVMETMSQMDIDKMDRNQLMSIEDVIIDTDLCASERLMQFLEQVHNPYCYLCGTTPVKVRFQENGRKLSDLLKNYFISLKR